ncbi:PHA/PHB synthase family protein [Paracoccus sp. NGMCC 1.201697]|uniref:PHA/PHB synthase family protein n=1 Tax=Paracoccus broussonetiae subsp. drimophilus TaxID=3373869 RepID=A0ABW7LL09_9RHOB
MEDADEGGLRDRDLSDIIEEMLSGGRNPVDKLTRLLRVASDVLSSPPRQDAAPEAATGKGFLETLAHIVTLALDDSDMLARHLSAFAGDAVAILQQSGDAVFEPSPKDRRFRDPLWRESPVLRGLMQIYFAWNSHVQDWLDAQPIEAADRLRIQFVLDQMKAALSPTNLPIHPSAIKRAESSAGRSAVQGLKNFALDLQANRGMPRQIRPGAYRLGETLAMTPGAVIFRNEQLELIQYAPQTDRVHMRPVLLIPPQINKYYAFDLKPQNSVLGYLVSQGFQVFTISWKNPGPESALWGIETYLTAILQAIGAIRLATGADKVNLISACAGGLTAISLLGHLAQVNAPLVASHSLLVTALYPGNGSILEAFTTAGNLELARRISEAEGTMDGLDLSHLFVWLRPEDLVWSFWVNNNLLGRQPPPLDVLYWDNDPTRVPARLHSDFIDVFLWDVFRTPGRQILFDRPIDYGLVRVPTYFVGGLEDYLMPWRGIYRAVDAFGGQNRFVLSTSGHVQSILRPPNLANTEYFVNDDHPPDPDRWLLEAERRPGTWWVDWTAWLRGHASEERPAPATLGSAEFPPLCPAPGRYVQERMLP